MTAAARATKRERELLKEIEHLKRKLHFEKIQNRELEGYLKQAHKKWFQEYKERDRLEEQLRQPLREKTRQVEFLKNTITRQDEEIKQLRKELEEAYVQQDRLEARYERVKIQKSPRIKPEVPRPPTWEEINAINKAFEDVEEFKNPEEAWNKWKREQAKEQAKERIRPVKETIDRWKGEVDNSAELRSKMAKFIKDQDIKSTRSRVEKQFEELREMGLDIDNPKFKLDDYEEDISTKDKEKWGTEDLEYAIDDDDDMGEDEGRNFSIDDLGEQVKQEVEEFAEGHEDHYELDEDTKRFYYHQSLLEGYEKKTPYYLKKADQVRGYTELMQKVKSGELKLGSKELADALEEVHEDAGIEYISTS